MSLKKIQLVVTVRVDGLDQKDRRKLLSGKHVELKAEIPFGLLPGWPHTCKKIIDEMMLGVAQSMHLAVKTVRIPNPEDFVVEEDQVVPLHGEKPPPEISTKPAKPTPAPPPKETP
jgi:hypothetical protein